MSPVKPFENLFPSPYIDSYEHDAGKHIPNLKATGVVEILKFKIEYAAP